jgi:peptide/nickel transport system substrate-binding protein
MKGKLVAWGLAAALASISLAAAAKPFAWTASLDALSMDPHATNNSFTTAFTNNIYETLVRFDERLRIEPALAERWALASPTVWRFTLRRGVRFHNGEPFSADDVVFSWQRTQSPGALVKGNLRDIRDVRKVDAHTVDVETHAPFPLLLQELMNLAVMSKAWCAANDATEASDLQRKKENFANRNANGTGPFVLKSRDVDVKTVLDANPHWWDKPRHNLAEVVFMPVKADATRTAALLSGAFDATVSVPLQDIARINASGMFAVVQGPELRTIFLGMDQHRDELLYSDVKGKNPFKDIRVRKAIYQAIDVETIRKTLMRGVAWPAGMIPSPLLNSAPQGLNTRLLPFDPDAARKLLNAAGYPDGFGVAMQCPNDRYVYDEQICVAIGAMLSRVGIRTTAQIEPAAKWLARVNANDISLYMLGHAGLPMADTYAVLIDVVATASPTTGTLNAGRYSNPAFDAMLPRIAAELDPETRRRLIGEAVAIERNEISHIPLHQQPVTWAARNGIELRQGPDNQLRLWLVERN